MYRFYFLAALVLGCAKTNEDDWDSANPDGVGGGGGGNITANGGLEDLTQNLDEGGCDSFDGTPLAGATSYFYGLYQENNGTYSGYEQFLLFANDTWAAQGNSDCVVQWTASGFEGSPENPAVATDAIDVVLTLDRGASTCSEEMMQDFEDSSSEHYDLRIMSDQVDWYYSSGTQFGSGLTNGSAMNFITEKSCRWF